MADPTDSAGCAALADDLIEVATGAASGPSRARVLDHLAECNDCRRELEELTRVADEVLLMAPPHEPPAGFESAVLGRIAAGAGDVTPGSSNRRHWVRNLVLAAAAVVIGLIGAGAVWLATDDERELAAGYRETLDIADGRYFTAAPILDADGTQVGHVFLYQGEPSWVFAVLGDAPAPGAYDVTVTTDEWTDTVATCDVEADTGGAGGTIDANIYQIREVRLVAPGGPTLVATLPDHSS